MPMGAKKVRPEAWRREGGVGWLIRTRHGPRGAPTRSSPLDGRDSINPPAPPVSHQAPPRARPGPSVASLAPNLPSSTQPMRMVGVDCISSAWTIERAIEQETMHFTDDARPEVGASQSSLNAMQDHSLSIRVLAGALVFMALMVGGYALPMAAGATGADQPSSGATANRRAAVEDATSLLGRLQLPPGATDYFGSEPAGANAPLADPPIRSGSPNLIDLPTWWLVPGQPHEQVLSWIETHEPEGSVHKVSGESHFGAVTESWFAAFEWPNIKEVLGNY